jgi:hypothetical protein
MIGNVTLDGYWTAVCRGPDGEIKQKEQGHNVVTTNGKEFLASFLNSAATGAATFLMRYVGVGTDSTGEANTDTDLGAQVNRVSGVVTYVSGQIFQVEATFATGSATGDISEYGLFSDSSSGTMLSRDTEATIAVGASDTLEVTMQLTIS